MKLREAFLVADRVVCHTCQTVTPHEVHVDEDTLQIFFTCKVCGEEMDEDLADIAITAN